MLSSVRLDVGRRPWLSFSTRSRPPLNSLAHVYTRFWDRVMSPNCACKRVKISEGLTPSFVKNFMTMRCATDECTSRSVMAALKAEHNASVRQAVPLTPIKTHYNRPQPHHVRTCLVQSTAKLPFIFDSPSYAFMLGLVYATVVSVTGKIASNKSLTFYWEISC